MPVALPKRTLDHPGMKTKEQLRSAIADLDRRGYKGYREIEGSWDFGQYSLVLDHAQSDPFAQPSRFRALIPGSVAGLPPESYSSESRARGTEAFLARGFADTASRESRRRGTGRSGEIRMTAPGQEVLPQTAVMIGEGGSVEARFTVGLPARGRRIVSEQAIELLLQDVPAVIEASPPGRQVARGAAPRSGDDQRGRGTPQASPSRPRTRRVRSRWRSAAARERQIRTSHSRAMTWLRSSHLLRSGSSSRCPTPAASEGWESQPGSH